MDFVFYDLETTGISPEFDQPLQFAAIWTDENFVEKARINIRCRLAPHILPSPQALVVTRVAPDHLIDPSLPSLLDFAQQVAELTERWSPSIWVGCRLLVFVAAVYGSAVAPLGLLGCGCGMGLTSEVGSRQRTVWCFSRWSASAVRPSHLARIGFDDSKNSNILNFF